MLPSRSQPAAEAGRRATRAQLEIGALDPFLDDEANADEVSRLARRAADLSSEGEVGIRRADRAIALALGLEPRFDTLFGSPATTGR